MITIIDVLFFKLIDGDESEKQGLYIDYNN